MTSKIAYFESLRHQFPEMMSKEQFYKVAHISKATALYLLSSGKIPCKDSGKKTRRYCIRTDDVIFYLIDRELHPGKYCAVDAWYKTRSGYGKSRTTYRQELSEITGQQRKLFLPYLERQLADYGDLLTVKEVSKITDYCHTTVRRWCESGKLRYFYVASKFLIPKCELISFLTSPYCCNINRKTWKHLLLISEFLDEIKGTE